MSDFVTMPDASAVPRRMVGTYRTIEGQEVFHPHHIISQDPGDNLVVTSGAVRQAPAVSEQTAVETPATVGTMSEGRRLLRVTNLDVVKTVLTGPDTVEAATGQPIPPGGVRTWEFDPTTHVPIYVMVDASATSIRVEEA